MTRGRAANDPPDLAFTVEVDGAEAVASDATHTAAGVLITAEAGDRTGPAAQAVEVIVMDRSWSMHRDEKLDEAKRAVNTAIDALRDGTYFAVISGNDRAELIYP